MRGRSSFRPRARAGQMRSAVCGCVWVWVWGGVCVCGFGVGGARGGWMVDEMCQRGSSRGRELEVGVDRWHDAASPPPPGFLSPPPISHWLIG